VTTEYVITYYGEDIDGADTLEDARKQVVDLWSAVCTGLSPYWDPDDFECFEANDEGTGFRNAIKIVVRTYPND